jgi:NDP-sugar pyrophosphorylase family protein
MSNYTVHSTAIVDEGAQIGENTRSGTGFIFAARPSSAAIALFGQNVFVGNKVVIGNNVKVQNNVSVYDNVTLEDDVFCGPSMVFTNVYNPRSAVSRKDEYRNTLVKRGATLGPTAPSSVATPWVNTPLSAPVPSSIATCRLCADGWRACTPDRLDERTRRAPRSSQKNTTASQSTPRLRLLLTTQQYKFPFLSLRAQPWGLRRATSRWRCG